MSEKKADEKIQENAAVSEENVAPAEEEEFKYTLDIPEDEIWSYRIEGLQAPHIGKPFEKAGIKKFIFVTVLLIAIGISIYLSVRVVHSDLYKYTLLDDGTYRLEKFSNNGSLKEVTVDYVVDNETGEKDETKVVSEIAPYAFNCDEVINKLTIGKDVRAIDGKSIYSCWWLTFVEIDDENPYYCDIDGVIYNKEVTEVIFYPNDHDKYLRLQNGYAEIGQDGVQHSLLVDDSGNEMEELWGTTKKYDEIFFQKYNRNVRTYVIPSTVTKIGELAFAYSNIVDLYIPEGVTVMDNMAIFKNSVLTNIYSYKTQEGVSDTTYKGIDGMSEIYSSLPEGLEFIGSDCMYYERGLSYMYIPASVTKICHHALWDAVYKDNGELVGVKVINVAADEDSFAACETGDHWRPQYDYKLFKKSVDLNYGAERESRFYYNMHRQYYWAIQWLLNNTSDDVKNNSSYLVKDLNGDGVSELILRVYNEETKQTQDRAVEFSYGYLEDYEGEVNVEGESFSELTDNAQLDVLLDYDK